MSNDLGAPPGLRGRRILIVESEAALVLHLQNALEDEGAEALAVTDPYSPSGTDRVTAFTVCAAVINSVHRGIACALDVPVLIYGANTPIPPQVDAIVRELKGMLSEGC